jgi:hypothetical protein
MALPIAVMLALQVNGFSEVVHQYVLIPQPDNDSVGN